MANVNLRNDYRCIGRVADDLVFCDNEDGSKTVCMTVLVQNNYKNKSTGNYDAVRVHLQQHINADSAKTNGTGIYGLIGKGDMVHVAAHMENDDFVDAQGQTHYKDILVIDDVQMLESKAVTSQRAAMYASAAQGKNA